MPMPAPYRHAICRKQMWSLALRTSMVRGTKQVALPTMNRGGRLRCRSIADKPHPSPDKPQVSPDISLLSPELQQQWHVDKNIHLGAIKVKPESAINAVWQCSKCPAGQPHVWTAAVYHRTQGSQCPYCLNVRVCLHNSLATLAPEASKCWNHSKNESAPEQLLAGSSLRAEWKCPACKLEWQAPIFMRTRRRSGCPKCSSDNRSKKRSQPTFAEAQPAELAEWDYERNEAEGFFPNKVTLGSNKLVHWVCSLCPAGQPHRWTAMPLNRLTNGTGCPICSGRQACICNSLESLFPSIAAEVDVDKSGLTPSEITAHSHRKVWWSNKKRGSWKQAVYERSRVR